jgi:hypothetical protein
MSDPYYKLKPSEPTPDEERCNFDDATTETIAQWHDVYRSIYALWLASGSYETWAELELRNGDSEVNHLGMKARAALSRHVPTSYL